MPTRRELLSSATATLLLIPLTHCGSSTAPSGAPVATGRPAEAGAGGGLGADSGAEAAAGGATAEAADAMDDGLEEADAGGDAAGGDAGACAIEATSSQTADPVMGNALHTHTMCVPASDLANPPEGGVTYATSSTLAHTHTVTLARVDLEALAAGGPAMATSSTADQHLHTFAIVAMT
jgi:hypothetical protein